MPVRLPRLSPGRLPAGLWICCLFLVAFLPLGIQQYGLNQPVAVDAYLNGAFPATTPGQGSGAWILEDAWPNVDFVAPLFMAEEPGTNRIFVAEMNGRIQAVDKAATATTKSLVLDISSRTSYSGESGLLSFALHPRYGLDSNYLYVFYQHHQASTNRRYTRVSRFTMNMAQGTANPTSEQVLIHQYDRASNHNGGSIFFGNDGYLYISTGDEGGGNNTYGHGQDIDNRLMGGILRIDVDRNPATSHPIRRQPVQLDGNDNSFTAHYYIPNDNPWQDPNGGILEEFYAIGLRNPHRMTYDPQTGTTWIADVGQGSREEIDTLIAGGNYQWSFREGELNGPDAPPAQLIGTEVPPVHTYPRNLGNCVIGGYVYRGPRHADLQGQYLFADNGSKRVWTMTYGPGQPVQVTQLMTLPFGSSYSSISSFGVDADGELYILKLNGAGNSGGKIYKLARQNPGAPEPPALLSQTGAFTDLTTLTPASFLIPYELNQPFWSDAALKYRWMVVPNDGTHNTPGEKISYTPSGDWAFPGGTVLIKHFEYPMDAANPAVTRRLETRFMIHGDDGQYYGVTYRWRDDQSDAELLSDSRRDTLTVAHPQGAREIVWDYPSRGECLSCHNEASGAVLGPSTAQLNGSLTYPATGITANQLRTLAHLGMFDVVPDTTNLAALPAFGGVTDASVPVAERALAYLDANCASCHRPGTGVQAGFDARYRPGLAGRNLVYAPALQDLGQHDGRLIIPGDPAHSLLYQRLRRVHEDFAMPPLAKNLLDTAGVALIEEWISAMDPAFVDSCAALDFFAYPISSYGDPGQDQGTYQVLDGGATLLVQDNAWKKITYPYTITANTVLEFDFRSTIEGEEHAIAFDTDDISDGNRFHLYGTQSTGSIQAFNIYNGSGNWQHFSIPVGNYLNGTFAYIGFLADHDAAPGNGNSYFRNLRLYEGNCTALPGQAITFAPLPHRSTTDGPFTLQASSSAGLPVTFQVVSGPATLTNNTLTLTGQSGWVTVRASQGGNASFGPAPEVERTFFVAQPGKAQGTGLFATYYNEPDLSGTQVTRTDAVVDFDWGSGSPDPAISPLTFSAVWEGEIEGPASETFTFTTQSDDGVRLWVDNQLVIDHWTDQPWTEHSGTFALTEGQRVPIRLEYYQRRAYAAARLSWSSPSTPAGVVPQAFLYPQGTTSFPVTLLSFEAIPGPRSVDLRWETAREVHSAFFVLERSADQAHFRPLAEVPAAGYSQERRRYARIDPAPLAGINHYRLKQVDLDGSFTYSEVETVFFGGPAGYLQVRAFPNPVDAARQLDLELVRAQGGGSLGISLYDLQGRQVYSAQVEAPQTFIRHQLDLRPLPPGVYLLSVQDGDQQRGLRILVSP